MTNRHDFSIIFFITQANPLKQENNRKLRLFPYYFLLNKQIFATRCRIANTVNSLNLY